MADRKAVIKNADMSEDMQQDAIDCATQALEKYNIEKDIAAFIKKARGGGQGGGRGGGRGGARPRMREKLQGGIKKKQKVERSILADHHRHAHHQHAHHQHACHIWRALASAPAPSLRARGEGLHIESSGWREQKKKTFVHVHTHTHTHTHAHTRTHTRTHASYPALSLYPALSPCPPLRALAHCRSWTRSTTPTCRTPLFPTSHL